MFFRLSLRMRLTVFTAFVILIICILLTVSANFSVDRFFVSLASPAEIKNEKDIFVSQSDNIQYQFNSSNFKKESVSAMESVTISTNENMISKPASSFQNEMEAAPITISIVTKRKHLFSMTSLFFMALGTVLGSGAMWFMAGRILKPVHNLQKKIDMIQVNNLSERLCVPENLDEIGKLSISFNHMMDKIDNAFENQKRFSAHAAHELKTPLAVMQTNLEVLSIDDNPPPEQINKALSAIKNNTERMADLINNLFLMSANKDYEKNDSIVLADMAQSIFMELESMAEQKNIVFHFHETDITMTGNYEMLYRAFYNVIENCVKYNKKAGSIYISAQQTDKEYMIKITDTGIGISKEDQSCIFEPFYRADKSRSRGAGGSGLGLALVNAILKAHNGNISLESEIGIGSIFTIILPKELS